jgi:ubiquitin-conjugating enzyme E2 R
LITKPQEQGELKAPKNYPMSPPEFRFSRSLFHPNIYKDGRLCISILHTPGDDPMSGELASERWSPVQRIFTVLISILSLLDDAEVSSAANVDASVMLRKDPEKYKRIVQENVEASKRDIPADFEMPTTVENKPPPKEETDDDFWCDSESDFGADSDEDMVFGELLTVRVCIEIFTDRVLAEDDDDESEPDADGE